MATNNNSSTSKQNGGKMPPRALSRSNSDRQKKGNQIGYLNILCKLQYCYYIKKDNLSKAQNIRWTYNIHKYWPKSIRKQNIISKLE